MNFIYLLFPNKAVELIKQKLIDDYENKIIEILDQNTLDELNAKNSSNKVRKYELKYMMIFF